MPLDPETARHLTRTRPEGTPSYADLTVEEARARLRHLGSPVSGAADAVTVTEARIPAGVRLVFYRPAAGPLPILVFLHGGGWVLGDDVTYDALCRDFAAETGCLLVYVDYALAPEHPFPAAVTDCHAATAWLSEHGGEYGGDTGRLAVLGESSGGNLAAAVTLLARDGGPRIDHQFLVYPVTDLAMTGGTHERFAEGFGLTRRDLLWFRRHYLGPAGDPADPLAAPLRAPDHRGLPPALVVTAEYDPLRDDGEAYARTLAEAGVPVALDRREGLVHGFLDHMDAVPAAGEAFADLAAEIRRLLTLDHECAG